MQITNAGGREADKEMHSIAKEELADCTAALDELRLDLTSLLLPRYVRTRASKPTKPVGRRFMGHCCGLVEMSMGKKPVSSTFYVQRSVTVDKHKERKRHPTRKERGRLLCPSRLLSCVR